MFGFLPNVDKRVDRIIKETEHMLLDADDQLEAAIHNRQRLGQRLDRLRKEVAARKTGAISPLPHVDWEMAGGN